MKKDPSIILVANEDGFEDEVKEYLSSKDILRLRKDLNAKEYSVGDTEISYRTINHWQEMRLLPKGIQKGQRMEKV